MAYASASPTQKLDLYVPEGNGPFPLIINIHGGGFMMGDKSNPPLTDELLAASADLGTTIDGLFESCRALAPRQATPRQGSDGIGRNVDVASVSRNAAVLARDAAALGIPMPQLVRIIHSIAHRISLGTPDDRARAILGLLQAFSGFNDWPGAESLMKVFGIERELPSTDFATDLGLFLGGLRSRGNDLYAGIACLCAAQDRESGELFNNRDLLRRASARLAGEPG